MFNTSRLNAISVGADFLIAPQDAGVDCATHFNAVGFDRDLFRCRRHVRLAYGRACVGGSSERVSTTSCSKLEARMRPNSEGNLDQSRVGVSMTVCVDSVTIKKYGNRRLYNTETSAYENLENVAGMAKREGPCRLRCEIGR